MENNINPISQTNNPSETSQNYTTHPKPNFLIVISLIILIIIVAISSFVLGKYFTQNKTVPVTPPTPVVQQPTVLPTTDPTADWETYTNIKYSYEIKYPPNWKIDETNIDKIWIFPPQTYLLPGISIEYSKKTENEFFKEKIVRTAGVDNSNVIPEKFNLTGLSGTKIVINTEEGTKYFFVYINNKINNFIINGPVINIGPKSIEIDQILSTFRFLEADENILNPTPTSTLLNKLYIDNDYAYIISYPSNWLFRHTYGKNIEKAGSNDILSGIDLHDNFEIGYALVSIVINILDSHGMTNVSQWISKYDLNYPKNSIKSISNFKDYEAVLYKYKNSPETENETIYFIKGNYVYRIFIMEKGGISEETRQIINSFKP